MEGQPEASLEMAPRGPSLEDHPIEILIDEDLPARNGSSSLCTTPAAQNGLTIPTKPWLRSLKDNGSREVLTQHQHQCLASNTVTIDDQENGEGERSRRSSCCESSVDEGPSRFRTFWAERRSKTAPLETVQVSMTNAVVRVYCWPQPSHARPWYTHIQNALSWCGGQGGKRWKTILATGAQSIEFKPGTMTLLLGPPCSGTTTFLQALGGSLHSDPAYHVLGVRHNGEELEDAAAIDLSTVAYVGDADAHIPLLTVRQTALFAARCRDAEDDVELVDVILDALGLFSVADQMVGDAAGQGITAGERRRLSLAECWASKTRVLLIDRLSDGLDSSLVLQTVRNLRVWCEEMQAVVVAVLLQPPPEVCEAFDAGIVLQDCRVVFHGPAQAARQRLEACFDEDRPSPPPLLDAGGRRSALWALACRKCWQCSYGRSFVSQLWLCIDRQARLELRGVAVLRSVLMQLVTGLLIASIWTTIPDTNAAFTERDSLLFFSCLSCAVATQGTVIRFMNTKAVFHKQQQAQLYCAWAYWISITVFHALWGLIETLLFISPIYWLCGLDRTGRSFAWTWMAAYLLHIICSTLFCGCAIVTNSVAAALTGAAVLQVVLFLYSGFFIGWLRTPNWWDWMGFVSPQSYAYSIMLQLQYLQHEFDCYHDECSQISGLQHLESLGINATIQNAFLILLLELAVVWMVCGLCLWALPPASRRPHVHKRHSLQMHKVPLFDVVPIVLTWENLGYEVSVRARWLCHRAPATRRTLLSGVFGIARPGSMTAILGPSGCGKTTLLQLLAGQAPRRPAQGRVLVNGYTRRRWTFRRVAGYVEQNHLHCKQFTVLESLLFAARMRLASHMPASRQEQQCRDVAGALGLLELLDVGVRKLSADQRKYLGLAVELVGNPSVLFVDEPTTGLDRQRALQVVRDIRTVSRRLGIAVLATLNQPATDVFYLFSHAVVLGSGGWMAYSGKCGEKAADLIQHFNGIRSVPSLKEGENPAHWVLTLVAHPNEGRQERIVKAYLASKHHAHLLRALECYSVPMGDDLEFRSRYASLCGRQFWELIKRAGKLYWRSPQYMLTRTVLLFIFAIIFGTLFWKMGYYYEDDGVRMSFCYVTTFYCGFTYLYSAVSVLMDQRPVFYRERSAGMYSSGLYALAMMLAEVPYLFVNGLIFIGVVWPLSDMVPTWTAATRHFFTFLLFVCMCTFCGHTLAAVAPTFEVAFIISPALACWFSSLSGYYLPPASIPPWWLWAYWLNPFQYAYNSLVTNMLRARPIPCEQPSNQDPNDPVPVNGTANSSTVSYYCPFNNTQDYLAYLGLRASREWYIWDQMALSAYVLAFIVATFLGLQLLHYRGR
eukprot:EG_transcript_542